jgi:membrane protease YdiL (CAAX protease family)
MTALALLWGTLRGLTPGWWTFENAWAVPPALALGLALGLSGVLLSQQLDRRVAGIRKLGDRFASILGGTGARGAIQLAALSSVGEELLFRGCMQQEWGLWPATILFAVVHTGPQRIYLWWTASAFVFGLGLALLYEHQGGLLAPILMHFTINAINIRILGRRGKLSDKDRLQYDF